MSNCKNMKNLHHIQNWIFNFISIRYTRQVKPHDLYIVINKIRQWNKLGVIALDSISTPAAAATATAAISISIIHSK